MSGGVDGSFMLSLLTVGDRPSANSWHNDASIRPPGELGLRQLKINGHAIT